MKKNRLTKKRRYDIVVFDCDSTLTKIEGIDELARMKGKEKEVCKLTTAAMEGKAKFRQTLKRKLEIVRPCKKDLALLANLYIKNQVKEAKETIAKLKQEGCKVYIVSGAYSQAVLPFAKHLGVPNKNVFAINLRFQKNGNYLGPDWKNPLTKNKGKRHIIKELAKQGKTVLIGDGATDLEAKKAVDFFIGFGGVVKRQIVKENADVFITNLLDISKLCFAIETPNLLPILKIVQKGREIC
ncbi:HAD-IB family phosphatase [Candidatus Parcubacteria bacterium]|nr:HAD-IB family phosphatase [Patescibacteria group bacterium]MCG2688787.1 HAD-IB family phosphatase [Candidatus Parcubacteria bacterium]